MILPLRRADLPAVERVFEAALGTGWSRAQWETELARAWSVARVLRAGSGQGPCGFLVYWLAGDQAELIQVAVAPSAQRRGFGRALLNDAIAGARARGARSFLLEVRRSNGPAIALYAQLGFSQIGVRPRYYSDNGEDALLLRLEL